VEHGRAVLVAATSGVSAVIAPDGRVLSRTGVYRPAFLVATVPLRDPRTLADRMGAGPEWVLALLGLATLLAPLLRRRAGRDRGAGGGSVAGSRPPGTQRRVEASSAG